MGDSEDVVDMVVIVEACKGRGSSCCWGRGVGEVGLVDDEDIDDVLGGRMWVRRCVSCVFFSEGRGSVDIKVDLCCFVSRSAVRRVALSGVVSSSYSFSAVCS